MAAFHIVFNCSLAMFWEGSWSYSAAFQFGLPVLVYTAELHSGWDLWGLWARCYPLFSGGPQGAPNPLWASGHGHVLPSDLAWWTVGRSFVSSGPSGLRFVDNGTASRLRGAGLPQYPPARRSCKREKWGQSRRFLCPAEWWPEVHLRGLWRERAPWAKWWVFS